MSNAANSINQIIPQSFSGLPTLNPQNEVFSYRHAVRLTDEAEISLTTAQGDRVTLSRAYENVQTMGYTSSVSDSGREQSLTRSGFQVGSFSLSIQGDLNDEELADIKDLIKDLSKVANHFYSGRMDTAVDQAMKIGDTGTITEFSANFNYSATVAVSQLEQHPIPAFSAETMESLPDPKELADRPRSGLPAYAEMLQARWQQIWGLLMDEEEKAAELKAVSLSQPDPAASELAELTAAPAPTPIMEPDESPLAEAAQVLFDRTAATIADHPRFSPFARPLVNSIIDRQAANNGTADPAPHQLGRQLAHEFSRIFDNWLVSV